MKSNPLDSLQLAEYRELKLAYNKSAVIIRKPKIALPKGMLRKLIRRWCSESSSYLRTHHIDSLLGTATMLYVSTGTRAGNILMGTGDNKDEQVLLVGDVNMEHYLARPRSPSNKRPLFIINARQKNNKFPVITSIPFNTVTSDPAQFCTATRLRELVLKRKSEGAGPDQPLFLHPRGHPLSTGVANTHLQSFVKEVCREKQLPQRYAKLFSLKSFRKSVATEMAGWGASPQTLAKKLKHNAIDSQMSYICKYHDNNEQFERDLYKCITPRKA
jgi:integrase